MPLEQPAPQSDLPVSSLRVMEAWGGVNTATLRPGIPDDQLAWCDGFMPLAPRNLRTLPGTSGKQLSNYTAANPPTIVCFDFGNFGSTPVLIAFMSDGSVLQFNTASGAQTTVAVAATITSPTMQTIGMAPI